MKMKYTVKLHEWGSKIIGETMEKIKTTAETQYSQQSCDSSILWVKSNFLS